LFETSRIQSLAHGGQTLTSRSTAELAAADLPEGLELTSLGRHRLKDLATPMDVLQVDPTGLRTEFPPLRASYIGWVQDFPDPSDFYDPIFSCAANVPGGASYGWYCNEDADALAAAARGESDDVKRLDMYRRIQDLVMADVPSIPLYFPVQVGLVSKRVVGDPFHPVYFVDLAAVDVTE